MPWESQGICPGSLLSIAPEPNFEQILGKVKNLKNNAPFVVGVFRGDRKPDDANEFLRRFVDKLRGYYLGHQSWRRTIPLRLNALVGDAPAKAFILNIRSHLGTAVVPNAP